MDNVLFQEVWTAHFIDVTQHSILSLHRVMLSLQTCLLSVVLAWQCCEVSWPGKPTSQGHSLQSALGISRGLRLYFTVYPSSRNNTDSIPAHTVHLIFWQNIQHWYIRKISSDQSTMELFTHNFRQELLSGAFG